jgi:pimeloyl-ACP methyl ester carboxylesterase
MPNSFYRVINQYQVHYLVAGKGTPVILVHALGGFAELWTPVINALSQNYCVYAIDIPGYGRSEKPRHLPYTTYTAMSNFVIEFMNALQIERAILIGHSMGGGVAVECASSFPDRVYCVVIVDSSGIERDASWLWRILVLPLIGEIAVRPTRMTAYFLWMQFFFNKRLISREHLDLILEMISMPNATRLLLAAGRQGVNILGQRMILRSKLQTVLAPTLVVWGKEDKQVPVKHAFIAGQEIPSAKVCIMSGCGHIPFIEKPDEFNQVTLDFLSQCDCHT